MQYQVIILLSEEKIAAMDVSTDGRMEAISIEGNDVMAYGPKEELKDFCQCLKDYYSIENFSELEMSISIIKFDAISDNAVYLFEEIKTAKECNLIGIEKLLPLLVLKEGLAKPDIVLQAEIFGIGYSIRISGDLKFECKQEIIGKNQLEIPVKRLSLLYSLDGNNWIDNKQELEKCQEEFRNEMNCKEALIKKLEHELGELQMEKAKADAALEKAKQMLEQKSRNVKRYVCKFIKRCSPQSSSNSPWSSNFTSIFSSVDDWLYRAEYRIAYFVDNGDIVKQYQEIARVDAYYLDKRMKEFVYRVRAGEGGRVYCLMSSDATIKDGDAVALIGDLSDTKEDVMSWYEKNK